MDVGRYLVEAHLKEGRSVSSLARDHGLHRSWIYKLLALPRGGRGWSRGALVHGNLLSSPNRDVLSFDAG